MQLDPPAQENPACDQAVKRASQRIRREASKPCAHGRVALELPAREKAWISVLLAQAPEDIENNLELGQIVDMGEELTEEQTGNDCGFQTTIGKARERRPTHRCVRHRADDTLLDQQNVSAMGKSAPESARSVRCGAWRG